MAKEVKIPQISEGVESANVSEVLVKKGDSIEKDQALIVLETDKASVEVPSSDAGTVQELKVEEGDEVNVGDVILILEENGEEEEQEEKEKKDKEEEKPKEEDGQKEKGKDEDDEEKDDEEKEKDLEKEKKATEKSKEKEDEKDKEKAEDQKEKEEAKKDKPEEEDTGEEMEEQGKQEVAASPAVRRLARELGIDLASVEGSGPRGRITEEDVKSHTKKQEKGKDKAAPAGKLSLPDFSKWGATETKPLSGIRMATGKSTTTSWQNIPHVFQFDEADISGIEKYMEKNKEKAEKEGGKLTITAILVKIIANALQQFPKFNASIDVENEQMIQKKYINISIAVDTEKGLLMPVLRDVDRKSIFQLSAEISEIAKKARSGELGPEEMKGGNFSISNLGGIGGTNFTPIIYHPQVAILGVSRAKKQPRFIDGNFEPRDILPLSLSYDHRLIDGAEGAAFLNWIAQALEDPYKGLLGA